MLDRIFQGLSGFIEFISFECILTRTRRPNGGVIILFRALGIALIIYLVAIFFKAVGVRSETLQLFGAIFTAAYFALYARFASQWVYLANLYNQIKQTEARTAGDTSGASKNFISQWKAGFLEDAEELHLATKPIFASVIKVWTAEDESVKKHFIKNTPGNEERFDALIGAVKKACELHERKIRKRLRW